MTVESDMTAENLRSAFGGESQAYQRYQVWAEKAGEDGFPGVATLFRAVAYAEQVHARNHFQALENAGGEFTVASGAAFGLDSTAENLARAIAGEKHEIEEMYPSFSLVAKDQQENEAVRAFHYAVEAEKTHADLFKDARKSVERGSDFEMDYVDVCEVCGYTVQDETPEYCPVCGEAGEDFRRFE